MGIFLKHRALCLASLLTSLYSLGNGRAAQDGAKSYLSFAVMGLIMCYAQMYLTPPAAASAAAAGSA